MPRSKTNKLVIAATCRACGSARALREGEVAPSSYGQCCSDARVRKAGLRFNLRPITYKDFDGPYLIDRHLR